MKRRDLLQKTGLGTIGLALGCRGSEQKGAPISSQKKVKWRLVSSFPRSLDTLFGSAEVLANRIREITGGNFDIRVFPAGELVGGLEVLDAVQQNSVQMGHTASYYYIGKNPALAFDCCVPFGMTARQQTAWLHQGGGLELTRKLFADFNIINFPAGNTGVQMGGWFNKEIHSLADMQGLKMRIPGIGGKVMANMGVAVQTLAGGEIYTALERGAIDATEWVGPYDDEKLGFHKVAKYYYYPGWWEPGPSLSFYVNQKAWASLSSEYKAIFIAAAKEAEMTMMAKYDTENPKALQRLLQTGIETRPFAKDILDKAHETALALYEQTASSDPEYRKLYQEWKKARTASFGWFGLAENMYGQFAFSKG